MHPYRQRYSSMHDMTRLRPTYGLILVLTVDLGYALLADYT